MSGILHKHNKGNKLILGVKDAKEKDVLDVNSKKCTNTCLVSGMCHRHNMYSNRVKIEKKVPKYSHIYLPYYFI